jgi:hypothetical protein
MNKFKRLTIYCLIAINLIFSSCMAEVQNVTTEKPMSTEINWTIAFADASIKKDLSLYPIGKLISKDVHVYLENLSENYEQKILKRLQSGIFSDLLTVKIDDPINTKLGKCNSFRLIDTLPEIIELIPKNIRDYHYSANGLKFVPGGFGQENYNIAAEGWFVNSYIYEQIGLPPLKNAKDIINSIQKYKKWCNSLEASQKLEYFPVLGGQKNQAYSVLEHLFGIIPEMKKISIETNTVPSAYNEMLVFLRDLGKNGVSPSALQNESFLFTNQICDALFFIGETTSVQSYNRAFPQNPYIFVQPILNKSGFEKAYSPFGAYATYISCDDKKLSQVKQIVTTLLSTKGSYTSILGIENKDWLLDDNEKVVLFSDTKTKMQKNDYGFINNTGIGIFNFLSSIGVSYPNSDRSDIVPSRDILSEIRSSQIDMTSEIGIKQSRHQDLIRSTCEAALLQGAAQNLNN